MHQPNTINKYRESLSTMEYNLQLFVNQQKKWDKLNIGKEHTLMIS